MNGIPEKIDEKLLLGARLIQVRIGENEVILRFDNETSVTLECEVSVATGKAAPRKSSHSVFTGTAVLPLLGASVLEVTRISGLDLAIRFERDTSVTLHDSNARYESFSIINGDCQVIV